MYVAVKLPFPSCPPITRALENISSPLFLSVFFLFTKFSWQFWLEFSTRTCFRGYDDLWGISVSITGHLVLRLGYGSFSPGNVDLPQVGEEGAGVDSSLMSSPHHDLSSQFSPALNACNPCPECLWWDLSIPGLHPAGALAGAVSLAVSPGVPHHFSRPVNLQANIFTKKIRKKLVEPW